MGHQMCTSLRGHMGYSEDHVPEQRELAWMDCATPKVADIQQGKGNDLLGGCDCRAAVDGQNFERFHYQYGEIH